MSVPPATRRTLVPVVIVTAAALVFTLLLLLVRLRWAPLEPADHGAASGLNSLIARGWWRYLFLIPAIVMPVAVAVARMYRGEHHPTDILASVLFAALWLTATTMLIKPNGGGLGRGAAISRHSTDWDYTDAAVH